MICLFDLKDYHRKRHREDDRHHPVDMPKRSEHEPRRNADHESRPVGLLFPFKFGFYLVLPSFNVLDLEAWRL